MNKTLSAFILSEMHRHRLLTAQLSARTGIHRATLSKMLSGDLPWTWVAVASVAKVFGYETMGQFLKAAGV